MADTEKPAKPPKTAYQKLKRRHRLFVDAWLETGVGRHAALRIMPHSKRPDVLGSKLRARPEIQAAIAEREAMAMEASGISRTRTWIEIRRVAYFDHRKMFDQNGDPIPLHKLDNDTIAAIAGIDVEELFAGKGEERTKIGELKKYRTWSKVDALKLILQAQGELVERHELTGRNGGPIETKSADELTDEQLEAIARRGRPARSEPEEGEG